MNKENAQWWADKISSLLSGHELVSTFVLGSRRPEIKTNQFLEKTYIREYEGNYWVSVHDSYSVMSDAREWTIDADKRTIYAETTNASGEKIVSSWTLAESGGFHEWDEWNDAMRESRRRK